MMHPKLRWVMFAAALGFVACEGDPTDSLRNGAHGLRASPGSVFVPQGDSVAILTELLDEQGNRLTATFSMTSSDPANFPVDLDNSFIPVYDAENNLIPPTDATRARFFVKGISLTAGVLTATSGGLTQTIPVISVPSVQGSLFTVGTLSSTTTALGDTVTVTIPAPWKFRPTAKALTTRELTTTPGRSITVGVSADSSSLRFIPGPGIDTTVSFSPAVLTYGPANDPLAPPLDTFSLKSSAYLNSPPIGSVTISATAPGLGVPVTATAPAGFRFTDSSTVIIVDTTTHDTTAAAVTGLSPDSSQLTFVPFPDGNGLVFVDTMRVGVLPALGNYTLASTQTLTSAPPPPNFPASVTNANPAIQDTVTLTANAPFAFLPTATLHHDSATGPVPTILSVSSSSISFIAIVGEPAGPMFVDGVTAGVLQFTGLASSVSITPAAGFAGTDAFATAPTLAVPGVGQTATYLDGGFGHVVPECDADQGAGTLCRVYKFVLGTAATVDFSVTWQGTTDLGLYFYDNGGNLLNPFPTVCDAGGNGGGGPETCSQTLAAGTYFLVVADFGPFYPEPLPAWIQLEISR